MLRVTLSNMAWINLDDLSLDKVERLKKILTVKQRPTSIHSVLTYIQTYKEDVVLNRFGVPNFFYLKTRPPEDNLSIQLSNGGAVESDMVFNGTLREGQLLPFQIFMKKTEEENFYGGIISLGCGEGKTVLALKIISELKRKTLVIVHKEFLVNQWKERIAEFIPTVKVGRIQQDECNVVGKDIVIGMIHSLALKEYPGIYNMFGVVVNDEAHRISAETFSEATPKFNSRYRLGLSVGGDSSVLYKKGNIISRVSIKDMFDGVGVIDVSDKGIYVRAFNFESRRFVWSRLLSYHRYNNSKNTYRILTDKNIELVVTEDHSVYRIVGNGYHWVNNSKKYFGKVECVMGCELKVGDYLIAEKFIEGVDIVDRINIARFLDVKFLASSPVFNSIISNIDSDFCKKYKFKNRPEQVRYRFRNGKYGNAVPLNIVRDFGKIDDNYLIYKEGGVKLFRNMIETYKLAWFLGFFIGDGCIDCSNKKVILFVNKKEVDYVVEKLVFIIEHFGLDVKYRDTGSGSIEIWFSHAGIYYLLKNLFDGQKACSKRIPSVVYSFPLDAKKEFIRGMIDSDGYLMKKDRNRERYVYVTSSKELALDLVEMLKFIDVVASFNKRKCFVGGVIKGRRILGRESYAIGFSRRFFDGEEKGQHFEVDYKSFEQVKIKKIEKCEEKYVYDFTVYGTENFVANGLLVHNTATPKRKDGTERIFFNTLGDVLYQSKEEHRSVGVRKIRTPFYFRTVNGYDPTKISDERIVTVMSRNADRNRIIVLEIFQACEKDRKCLILSDRLEHLDILAAKLKEIFAEKGIARSMDFYVGGRKEEELRIAAKATVIFGCVPDDTDCLTYGGWKKVDELKMGELIASYDMGSKKIRYTALEGVCRYDYDGKMYSVDRKAANILMTPNHRNVVVKRVERGGDVVWEEQILRADELNSRCKIRVGAPVECSVVGGIGEDMAELMGWVIAEGSYKSGNRAKNVVIYQKEGVKADRIESLLTLVGLPYKKAEYRKGQLSFHVSAGNSIKIREICPDKKLNKNLIYLPMNEANALFRGLIDGDGHVKKDGRITFVQKDKETVDWFLVLSLRLGFRPVVGFSGGVYRVYLTRNEFVGLQDKKLHLKVVDYKGKIWCPKTEFGTWVARRNGSVFITGNTYQMAAEGLDIPDLDTLYLATPKSDIEQSVGRILRKVDGKKRPIVVEFLDERDTFSMRRWRNREKYYKEQGWL